MAEEYSLTEFEGTTLSEAAATHECKKHGPVVAFYPLAYKDQERGIDVRSGPFCMMCLIDHQNREYAPFLVYPIKDKPDP